MMFKTSRKLAAYTMVICVFIVTTTNSSLIFANTSFKNYQTTARNKTVVSVLNDAQQQQLTQWEHQLLGLGFTQEVDTRRIARLESAVFGKSTTQTPLPTIAERIVRLQKAIDSTQPKYPTSLIAAIEKQQDATVQQGETIVFDGQPSQNPPLNNADALPKLEKKLIGTIFVNDTVDNRLARLEQKVFGRVSSEDDAVNNQQRLDRLITVAEANPRGGVGDLKRDRFMQQVLPIILTSLLLVF
jgi:hypothetical protein